MRRRARAGKLLCTWRTRGCPTECGASPGGPQGHRETVRAVSPVKSDILVQRSIQGLQQRNKTKPRTRCPSMPSANCPMRNTCIGNRETAGWAGGHGHSMPCAAQCMPWRPGPQESQQQELREGGGREKISDSQEHPLRMRWGIPYPLAGVHISHQLVQSSPPRPMHRGELCAGGSCTNIEQHHAWCC